MRERTAKVKTSICESYGRVYNLLPHKDKIDIMEKLLQMPEREVYKLTTKDDTPAFVYACAKLLEESRLDVYFDTLRQCQRMYEKEQRQMA